MDEKGKTIKPLHESIKSMDRIGQPIKPSFRSLTLYIKCDSYIRA